jgi:hypothetical protein
MPEAYQRKKEEIQSWLDDRRSKVRAFAKTHTRSLDRTISAEQPRFATDYELRRRDWPEEEE